MKRHIGPHTSGFKTNFDIVIEFSDQPNVCNIRNIPSSYRRLYYNNVKALKQQLP